MNKTNIAKAIWKLEKTGKDVEEISLLLGWHYKGGLVGKLQTFWFQDDSSRAGSEVRCLHSNLNISSYSHVTLGKTVNLFRTTYLIC